MMPGTSRATCSTPLTASSETASPGEAAGEGHRRQSEAAGSLQVHHHVCILREAEALRG